MNLNSIVQQLQAEQQKAALKARSLTSPASGGGTSGPSGSGNSSTITANDFLTLLVTELQNQDPTANTDPNAYVNQLVNVNSLQQLISINQEVGNITPPPASGTGAGTSSAANEPVVSSTGTPASAAAAASADHPATPPSHLPATQAATVHAIAPASLTAPSQVSPPPLRGIPGVPEGWPSLLKMIR